MFSIADLSYIWVCSQEAKALLVLRTRQRLQEKQGMLFSTHLELALCSPASFREHMSVKHTLFLVQGIQC